MNYYSIGLAAVSGCLAAIIAGLIFGKKSEKKTVYTIVTVLLFAIFNTASKNLILPKLNALKAKAEIESVFKDIPAFSSIKKYEPATYQKIINQVSEAVKKGHSQKEVAYMVRHHISRLVESRLPHASDEAIVAYMKVMVKEMEELLALGNGLCYKFLFPQLVESVNAREVFSKETQYNDLEALDAIIRTSINKRKLPSEAVVLPLLEPIFTELQAKFGDDVSMIENPTAIGIDKERVCQITKELYIKILDLPTQQAASVLRWILGQA